MAKNDVEVDLQREDESDHDLLTYGEVGVRLQQAVREQRALVARLEQSDGAGIEPARARLAALEEAFERNRRQPINDDNFERFFGYPGTPRRNT